MTRYGNPTNLSEGHFSKVGILSRPGGYLKRGRHPQSWFGAAGILSVQERRRSPCGYLRSWGGNVRMLNKSRMIPPFLTPPPISTNNTQAKRASTPRLTPPPLRSIPGLSRYRHIRKANGQKQSKPLQNY